MAARGGSGSSMSKNFEVLERSMREQTGTGVTAEALAPGGLRPPPLAQPASVPSRFRLPEDVAEEYIKLKTNLVMVKTGTPIRLLTVASAKHGDGTTSVATNLAIAYASDGTHRVLLVDTSFHRPALHRVFRFPRDPGVTDLLVGSGPFEEALRATSVPQLQVLTCGSPIGNPARLLETERLAAFLTFAREHFDVTIFDASPILPYSDARVLATRTDGTLLVIQANHTQTSAVERSKRQLTTMGARVVGAVISRQRHFVPEFLHDWV